MNEITLALTRFWQNKQISLPPMSTLLIAAGIMFFCFRLIVNGNRKEQEDAGILCSYLTYLDADRSSHLAAAFRQVIFAAL